MPQVTVYPNAPDPTHDISLASDAETIGLIYAQGPRFMQEIPISEPSKPFLIQQEDWTGGRGRLRYQDDPTGYFDAQNIWTMTDGSMFPVPQFRFAKGIRSCDSDLPSAALGLRWMSLIGNRRYISRSWTASASYSADKAFLWVRRIGKPGTLTLEVCANSGGDPGTVQKTVTKGNTEIGNTGDLTPPSTFLEFDWTTTQSLTSGTTYHLKAYGASTDDRTNHWEVGVDTSGTASKTSSDGSSWSTASFGMYFRVVDADINRKWHFFQITSALYAVSQRDDSGNSEIFINGDVFNPTSATSTVITDTSSGVSAGWTTDMWDGARIRIFDGPGDGQNREIASNTSTAITVSPALGTTPTTASKMIVYDTDRWQEITGHGLGKVVNRPAVANGVVFFPQGTGVTARRMKFDSTQANQHNFLAEATATKVDHFFAHTDAVGTKLYVGYNSTSKVTDAALPAAWATNLTLSTKNLKNVGSSDYPITNFYSSDGLYIVKPDGLFRMEGNLPKKVRMGFEDAVDTSNGAAVSVSTNGVWIGWNHSVVKIIGNTGTDYMNYRQGYMGMPDDRQGYCSNILSVLGWTFFVYDGGSSKRSSILAWNGRGWMELFRGWKAGVRIRSLFWQDNQEVRPRLWFDIDGDIAYIQFPLRCANPLLDESLAYQHDAHLITQTMDAKAGTLHKLFHSITVVKKNTNGVVSVDFQKNDEVGTGTWHNLGDMKLLDKKEFLADIGEAHKIRFRLRLESTSAVSPAIVEAYSIGGWITNPVKYQWVANFSVGTNQSTITGDDDFSPDDIVKFLKDAHENCSKIRMRSLKTSMDDKVVVLSAPVVVTDSITDEGWNGYVSVAMREA